MSEEVNANQDLEKALTLLEKFVAMIQSLTPGQFAKSPEWTSHLNAFFEGDSSWIENLHIERVLDIFKFPKVSSERIKQMTHDEKGEDLKQFSLRWLSKAFECFGLPGTTCDAVNVVCAMMGLASSTDMKKLETEKPSREKVMEALAKFSEKVDRQDWKGLWVPTHLIHDSEPDDMLTWLLLEFVHQTRRTKLTVMVQLPQDEEFQAVAERLRAVDVKVFFDSSTRNGDKVRDVWKIAKRGG